MPSKKVAAVSKPTYAVMVTEVIKTLNDRTGSSVQAITKQLVSSYKIDINKPALIKAIKKGVEQGDFVQIKASYKLNKKAPVVKPKKPAAATKKKVAPKTTTRKAATTTRKAAAAAATKPKKSITKKSKRTTTTATKKATTKTSTKKTATKKRAAKK